MLVFYYLISYLISHGNAPLHQKEGDNIESFSLRLNWHNKEVTSFDDEIGTKHAEIAHLNTQLQTAEENSKFGKLLSLLRFPYKQWSNA